MDQTVLYTYGVLTTILEGGYYYPISHVNKLRHGEV